MNAIILAKIAGANIWNLYRTKLLGIPEPQEIRQNLLFKNKIVLLCDKGNSLYHEKL